MRNLEFPAFLSDRDRAELQLASKLQRLDLIKDLAESLCPYDPPSFLEIDDFWMRRERTERETIHLIRFLCDAIESEIPAGEVKP